MSSLSAKDEAFLLGIADVVLGNSPVATTTAASLNQRGFDALRVDALIPVASVGVQLAGFVFKKIEPDKDSPQNFGLFVRRRPDSYPPFHAAGK